MKSKVKAWWEEAASGNANAQYCLGSAYFFGEGVPIDLTRALACWRSAARSGHAVAQYHLGVSYFNGEGVRRNPSAALGWWRKSAANGIVEAQVALADEYRSGAICRKDLNAAFHWYRLAAMAGDPEGECDLAYAYWEGEGVEVNTEEALQWFERAAAKGNAEAQFRLGHSYGHGVRVPADLDRGTAWLEKAAMAGHPWAGNSAEAIYACAAGRDLETQGEGFRLCLSRAEGGSMYAQYSLFLAYEDVDSAEAGRWLLASAQSGYGFAQFVAGNEYVRGNVFRRDVDQARKWWAEAAKHGYEHRDGSLEDWGLQGLLESTRCEEEERPGGVGQASSDENRDL